MLICFILLVDLLANFTVASLLLILLVYFFFVCRTSLFLMLCILTTRLKAQRIKIAKMLLPKIFGSPSDGVITSVKMGSIAK